MKLNILRINIFLLMFTFAMGTRAMDLSQSIVAAGTFESYDALAKTFIFRDDRCQKNISLKIDRGLLGVERFNKGQQVKVQFLDGTAYGLVLSSANPIQPSNYQCSNLNYPLSIGSEFGDTKNKCKELGFKSGTDDFSKCVLRLTK